MALKDSIEMLQVVEAAAHGYLNDRQLRMLQQLLRLYDSAVQNIFEYGEMSGFLKQVADIVFAQLELLLKLFQCDRIHVMIVDVTDQFLNVRVIGGGRGAGPGPAP